VVGLKDILKPDFLWDNVFEPFPYSKRYSQFVKIYLSSPDHYALAEWVGWVKSRFRGLLVHVSSSNGKFGFLYNYIYFYFRSDYDPYHSLQSH